MPAGHGAPRIPEQLAVVVSVQIDETRRHHLARGVDHLTAIGRVDPADLHDPTPGDPDVSLVTRRPQTVDHGPPLDHHIELRHVPPFTDGPPHFARRRRMAMPQDTSLLITQQVTCAHERPPGTRKPGRAAHPVRRCALGCRGRARRRTRRTGCIAGQHRRTGWGQPRSPQPPLRFQGRARRPPGPTSAEQDPPGDGGSAKSRRTNRGPLSARRGIPHRGRLPRDVRRPHS